MNIHTNSEQKIAELTSQGMSIRAISKTVGLSKSQVGRIIQKQKISSPATQPITKVAKIVKATAVKTNNSTAKTQTFIKLDKTQQKAKYEVSEEMKKYVPSIDGYIARKIGKTTDVDILTTAYEHNQNVLLVGECGTGKTKIISHIAYKKQLPYARVNLNGGTTPDQLIGHFVPNGEGGLKWQDGLLTQFVRHGGILAVDEINSCSSEILFFLYPLLDDERKLTLVDKDSEVIIANKNFMLVASLPFEEQVFMKEGLRPIGEIVEENFKKYQNEIKIHGVQTILNTKNKEIFCYSYDKKTKRVRLKKVTALLRHKPVDKIFELTLENGRKCRVTESHSVFSDIDKPIEVKNLQEGDSIVVPRKIEFPYKKKKNIFDVASLRQKYSTKPILFNEKKVWTYLSPINCRLNRYINMNSPELAWLIGFWIAEGSFSSGTNNKNADRDLIFFSNKDKKKILKIKNIIKKIFGCDCYIANDKRNGVLNLAIGTKILGILFREWGLTKNCYQKEIPSFVFNSNKKFIESLIDGMFAGDGCKCKQVYKRKDGTIKSYDKSYYATISKTLANQLSYLFLTLGIKCGIYYIAGKKEALRKQKDGSFTHYRRKGIYHIEILKREKTDSSMKKIKIIKKKEINYKGYVYDFEVCDDFRTDNFIGGFGGVMLHNTMNPAESGYEGRRPLDAGLKDRFHIKLFYDYDEAIENKLVKSKKILELARKLRFMRGKGELSTPVSLRMLLYYDNNSELFGEKVAFDMFLNSFESHEREPIRNVLEMIEKPVKVEAEPPTVLTGSNKVVTP